MDNIFLVEAAEFFWTVKAPDLKQKVQDGLLRIINKEPLEVNYKKLFGFMLFSYAMHNGPLSFFDAEQTAVNIGVIEELKHYAKDWIEYSQKVKNINS